MKSYSYLVNRHIKAHRKRSLLTIVGIICSIILFYTIGYLSNYINDIDLLINEEIMGKYDFVVTQIDKDSAKKLINNIKIDKAGVYKLEKDSTVKVGNREKRLFIYSIDDISMKDMYSEKLNLKEGRLPKKKGELLLSYSGEDQLGVSIGDKFRIEDSEYKVVGFYNEDSRSNQYSINGVTYLDLNNIDDSVSISLRLKNSYNKINNIKSIISDSGLNYDSLKSNNHITINRNLVYSNKIITFDGENTYLNEEVLVIMLLNLSVLILTIILTYGSINISLNERKKQFATLRCIGATPSKIKALLIKESVILGIFSVVPGILIAQIISWIITSTLVNPRYDISSSELNGKIYIDVIITTILLITINIVFATIIPVIKVGKLSPIEIVKTKGIENKKVKKRKSKIIRKVFGYKGELAYKNIRANNKNFIFTTVAMTLLLIIIISFNGYISVNNKFYEKTISTLKDITLSYYLDRGWEDNEEHFEEAVKESEELINDVKNLEVHSELYSNLSVGINPILQGATIINDFNLNQAMLLILDNESIEEILPHIDSNKNIHEFNSNDFIVVKTYHPNNFLNPEKKSPIKVAKDDEVDLYFMDDKSNGNIDNVEPIKMNYLGSIDSRNLINVNRYGYYNYLTIIVSKDFYIQNKELIKVKNNASVDIAMNIDKNKEKQILMDKLLKFTNENNIHLLEEKAQEIEMKKSIDVSFFLVYLALILILIIICINIINTKSIDINLRKKEFKMLLSIGMKKSDIKEIIVLEGLLVFFIASFIGGTISIIILKLINIWYEYMGSFDKLYIPFDIVFVGILIILAITILTSIVPYIKFKNLHTNDLMKNEE